MVQEFIDLNLSLPVDREYSGQLAETAKSNRVARSALLSVGLVESLGLAQKALYAAYERKLRSTGQPANARESLLLCLIHLHGCLSQKDARKRMSTSAAHISQIAVALEKRGFIRRSLSPSDRRVSILELTAAGDAVVNDLILLTALHFQSSLSDLSDADHRTLQIFLSALRLSVD